MFPGIKFKLRRFSTKECGAVTIEWVVLTTAMAGIAAVATVPVFTGTENVAETANSSMQSAMSEAGENN